MTSDTDDGEQAATPRSRPSDGAAGRAGPAEPGTPAVQPAPGVSVRVLDTGWMELIPPGPGAGLLCDEVGAAMWVALRLECWDPGRAADRLALIWDDDPRTTRELMHGWITDLRRAGIVLVRDTS